MTSRADRARPRSHGPISTVVSSTPIAQDAAAEADANQLDQGAAPRARGRRTFRDRFTLSRRLALVVRRDVPAQAARHRPGASRAVCAARRLASGAPAQLGSRRRCSALSPASPRRSPRADASRARRRRGARVRMRQPAKAVFHTSDRDGGSLRAALRAPGPERRPRPSSTARSRAAGRRGGLHRAGARSRWGARRAPTTCARWRRSAELQSAGLAHWHPRVRRSDSPPRVTPVDSSPRWRELQRSHRLAQPPSGREDR